MMDRALVDSLSDDSDGQLPESFREVIQRGEIPVVVGATASGKSDLIFSFSKRIAALESGKLLQSSPAPLEIISADAYAVYRGMDIGTAKPSADIRSQVPHHLIDILDPEESYSAGAFAQDAERIIGEILGRGGRPIVCGGSGLYVSALVTGLHDLPGADPDLRNSDPDRGLLLERIRAFDPAAAESLKDAPSHRLTRALEMISQSGKSLAELRGAVRAIPSRPYRIFAIKVERSELHRRINERTLRMFKEGLVREVELLRKRGVHAGMNSQKAIGYREVHRHLDGECSLDETISLVQRNSRRYAKRQETWIRSRFPGGVWI